MIILENLCFKLIEDKALLMVSGYSECRYIFIFLLREDFELYKSLIREPILTTDHEVVVSIPDTSTILNVG